MKNHPITTILIVTIWYLSLFTPPKTELEHIRFIDKWTHLVMYGSLVFALWVEDWRKHKQHFSLKRKICIYLLPVAMSGLIELVQAYCTTTRSGDWMDVLANAIGGLLGVLLSCRVIKNRGRQP